MLIVNTSNNFDAVEISQGAVVGALSRWMFMRCVWRLRHFKGRGGEFHLDGMMEV